MSDETKTQASNEVASIGLLAEIEDAIPLMIKHIWYFFPKKYHETIRVHLVETGRFESKPLDNGTTKFRLANKEITRQ
jgi:hypothetical protein